MGLSQNEAQQKITTNQILLTLVEGLKTVGDSTAFTQLVKDAYALPAAEQQKADDARMALAQNQALINQQKQQLADIETAQDNLDTRTKQIQDAFDLIDSKNADLKSREQALQDGQVILAQEQADLAAGQTKLQKDQDQLAQDQQTLADAQQKLSDDQAALKAKSAQLKALMG